MVGRSSAIRSTSIFLLSGIINPFHRTQTDYNKTVTAQNRCAQFTREPLTTCCRGECPMTLLVCLGAKSWKDNVANQGSSSFGRLKFLTGRDCASQPRLSYRKRTSLESTSICRCLLGRPLLSPFSFLGPGFTCCKAN